MFYGITQLNNYMEEDIHNHTLIVMFRGTPCMSSQKSELLYGNGVFVNVEHYISRYLDMQSEHF